MSIPWHAWLILWAPRRVVARLAGRATLWQVELGVLRMWHRILFRSNTIGTSVAPVRNTRRARIFAWRPLRFFGLVRERAITPWDLSGFLSSKEQILRHLLGAHHDGDQCVYDLQLLEMHPGGLDELHKRAAAVVDGRDPRAEWLRDLVVHEGYHELLLATVEAKLAGAIAPGDNPDITFHAFLRWCAHQPATPRETWEAWRSGRFEIQRGLV